MPRLLWLMFQVPMSSPQMTRIFGFSAANKDEASAQRYTIVIAIGLIGFIIDILVLMHGISWVLTYKLLKSLQSW
jgi:hypothetical protein